MCMCIYSGDHDQDNYCFPSQTPAMSESLCTGICISYNTPLSDMTWKYQPDHEEGVL